MPGVCERVKTVTRRSVVPAENISYEVTTDEPGASGNEQVFHWYPFTH